MRTKYLKYFAHAAWIIALLCGALAVGSYWKQKTDTDYDVQLSEEYTEVLVHVEKQKPEQNIEIDGWEPSIEVDFESLLKKNPDTVGWIYQEDTPINYPIVQGKNNSEYIWQRFDAEDPTAGSGTLFLDYQHQLDSNNLIVYGHNMAGTTTVKFGTLRNYLLDDSWINDHKTFELYTVDRPEGRAFDVFAVVKADTSDQEHADTYYSVIEDHEYQEYLDMLASESVIDCDISYSDGQQVLLLSTCITGHYHQRLLVCCIERSRAK